MLTLPFKNKKHLLFFFPNIEPGGTEKVIQILLPYFLQHFTVTCVTLRAPKQSTFQPHAHLNLIVLDGIEKKAGLKYWAWVTQFAHIIKKQAPHTILSFGEVPVVVSSIALTFTRVLQPIRLIHNVRNHESTFLKNTPFGTVKKKILQWALSKGTLVTGNSQSIADELKTVFHCQCPIHVIYNPIELSQFSPSRTAKPPFAAPHILNIARLDAQKGQSHLLKAFQKIQRKWPQARLTIIGQGPEENALRSLEKQLDLRHVDFLGWSNDIPAALSSAHIFCLSSLWEGMPNVLLEALASGTPVVSFDCLSGPREILKNSTYGQLVPTGDTNALADALIHLLDNKERYLHYVEQGIKRAKDFNPNLILQHWLSLI